VAFSLFGLFLLRDMRRASEIVHWTKPMRRALLPCCLVFVAAPAFAADVFSREHYRTEEGEEAMPLRGPIHRDWEGFYVGLNTAWHAGTDREVDSTAAGAPTGFNQTFKAPGPGVGVHAGYMWETNRVVYGLEADVEKTFVNGSISSGVFGRTDFNYNWQGSLRGRLGYAFEHFMIYGTGGVALLMSQYTDQSPAGSETYSKAAPGWTVGVGAEYAFSTYLSARLEYRYSSFGTVSLHSAIAYPGIVEKHTTSESAFRAGLSYRFNGY
jgi:outer membrane immunogenic protein